MVSFSDLDIIIIIGFLLSITLIGFIPSYSNKSEEYLLSGRRIGYLLFILTNVATWYGGILGVGEFSYNYGLVSWFTQGLPYYVFAALFAFLFASKIREASLFTIPDKIEATYGKPLSLVAAVFIFILVSPAPYLLMVASLINMIFNIPLIYSLILGAIFSTIYLFKGGYKSDIITDAVEFFIMFAGFIVIVFVAYTNYGGYEYLSANLPESHLKFTGSVSPTFIIVWFLIALWTFADPGFHQRCYAAKSGKVAKYGILISIIFWALFDFLTTSTGLYARAILPELENPVVSFPMLAEKILGPGLKGLFYAALFATILSTLNSFLFISATTFSKDILTKLRPSINPDKIPMYTRIGLVVTAIVSILFAYSAESVITLWYTIGSMCIPGLIFIVIGSYYDKFKLAPSEAMFQVLAATLTSILWYIIRSLVHNSIIAEIEPMIVGLISGSLIQFIGIRRRKKG